MGKYKIALSLVFIYYTAFNQNISPVWVQNHTTSGTPYNRIPLVKVDAENAAIICGSTYNAGPLTGFFTAKYDSAGVLQWTRTFNSPSSDLIEDCEISTDNSIYVGGNFKNPFTGQSTMKLFKYSKDGDVQLDFEYSNALVSGSFLKDLILDEFQNLYIIGTSIKQGTNGIHVLKFNANGDVVFDSIYTNYSHVGSMGGKILNDHLVIWGLSTISSESKFMNARLASNGELLDATYSDPYSDNFGSKYWIDKQANLYIGDPCCDYKLTKINLEGETVYQYHKLVTAPNPPVVSARLNALTESPDGFIYITGPYFLNDTLGGVALTTKLDSNGTVIWEKVYSVAGISPTLYAASIDYDSDIITVAGSVTPDPSGNYNEVFILNYTPSGDLLLGGISDLGGDKNFASSVDKKGQSIFVTGTGYPNVPGASWQFLAKYDLPTSTILTDDATDDQSISIYPNPFLNSFQVSLENMIGDSPIQSLAILNIQGEVVYTYNNNLQLVHDTKLEGLEHLPPGVYIVKIDFSNNSSYYKKLIKQK